MNTDKSEKAFNELAYYTLAHESPSFIHQHIVDAYGAQTADHNTKKIRVVFALIGLYLYLEKDFTGKEVQNFHMLMAKNKMEWPKIVLPTHRGNIDVNEVLATSPGKKRDKMIGNWCETVWEAYRKNRNSIIELAHRYQDLG